MSGTAKRFETLTAGPLLADAGRMFRSFTVILIFSIALPELATAARVKSRPAPTPMKSGRGVHWYPETTASTKTSGHRAMDRNAPRLFRSRPRAEWGSRIVADERLATLATRLIARHSKMRNGFRELVIPRSNARANQIINALGHARHTELGILRIDMRKLSKPQRVAMLKRVWTNRPTQLAEEAIVELANGDVVDVEQPGVAVTGFTFAAISQTFRQNDKVLSQAFGLFVSPSTVYIDGKAGLQRNQNLNDGEMRTFPLSR
jgi:hypothetical protein